MIYQFWWICLTDLLINSSNDNTEKNHAKTKPEYNHFKMSISWPTWLFHTCSPCRSERTVRDVSSPRRGSRWLWRWRAPGPSGGMWWRRWRSGPISTLRCHHPVGKKQVNLLCFVENVSIPQNNGSKQKHGTFCSLTLKWMGLFFFKMLFYSLMVFTINAIPLYETGPIQWIFKLWCGYWWPGALAPGHQ